MSANEHAAYVLSTVSTFFPHTQERKLSKKETVVYWVVAAILAALLVYTFPGAPWHN